MVMSRFKDALDAVNSGVLRGQDMAEIRLALKIADRIMREPSKGMLKKGYEPFTVMIEPVMGTAFRAMIEQMMKELNEGA